MNRGKRGEQIFTDKKDYYAFIALIKDCVEMWNIRVVAPDSEKIKGAVCREYDINEEDLLISKRGMTNEPRNMANYLMRHLMGSKGSLKNNFTFSHLSFGPSSAAAQSWSHRNSSLFLWLHSIAAAKSHPNLSVNSAKLFLSKP